MTFTLLAPSGWEPPAPVIARGAARKTCDECEGSGQDCMTPPSRYACDSCNGLGWSVSLPEALTPKVVREVGCNSDVIEDVDWVPVEELDAVDGLGDTTWVLCDPSFRRERLVLPELHIAVEQWRATVGAGGCVVSPTTSPWFNAEPSDPAVGGDEEFFVERRQALVAVLTDYEALPVVAEVNHGRLLFQHFITVDPTHGVWEWTQDSQRWLGDEPWAQQLQPGDVVFFPKVWEERDPEPLTKPCPECDGWGRTFHQVGGASGSYQRQDPCSACDWGRVPVVLEPDVLTEVEQP